MGTTDSFLRHARINGRAYRLRPLSRGGCAQTYLGEAIQDNEGPLVFKVPHREVLSNDHGYR